MAEADKPFPPSPRRSALAHRAGITAASPILVAGAAWIAALVALVTLGRAIAAQLGGWIARACSAADGAHSGALAPAEISGGVLSLVLPVVATAALAAVIAHLAQTRAAWFPRRRVEGAPSPDRAPTRRAALDLANAAIVGAVAVGWLWAMAPRLATLASLAPTHLLGAVAALGASLLAALAIAWVALGVLDALVRHRDHTRALAMSPAEKRADDRLSAPDPRWRRRRAAAGRAPRTTSDAVGGAAVVILGDDLAVAVAWDPTRQPIPTRTAVGRGPLATQILALARRHRVAVYRDPGLAQVLARAQGAIPEDRWPRLAEIVAATTRRQS